MDVNAVLLNSVKDIWLIRYCDPPIKNFGFYVNQNTLTHQWSLINSVEER